MQKDSIARNRSISTVRDRFQNSADRLLTQIGSLRSEQISFKVTKRTVPALTLYSNSEVAPALGYWSLFNGNGWSRGMAVPLFLRPDGFTLQLDFGSGLTPFYAYLVGGNWAADAEI